MEKMKNIKLYSIGNEKNYNYYIFDKKNYVIEILEKILNRTTDLKLYLHEVDKNYNQRKINFEKTKEHHSHIINLKNKTRLDIFYGTKKIFLILHCTLSTRKKFNEELEKISYMPKPSKKILQKQK
jgi:hypothetical protein